MKPLYQGKVDTFCAIYAVLNALRITHGIRTLKARDIFNETLLTLLNYPLKFKAVLEQTTDYIDIIDGMLAQQKNKLPLEYIRPYSSNDKPSADELWSSCQRWLASGTNRTVILRFMRFVGQNAEPVVRHWTTIDKMDDKVLHLFDSSHDAEAILNIHRGSFATCREDVDEKRFLFVQPDSLRYLRLPF